MSRVFWTKRLQKILIPYVLWSLFYYLFNQIMFHGNIRFDAVYRPQSCLYPEMPAIISIIWSLLFSSICLFPL